MLVVAEKHLLTWPDLFPRAAPKRCRGGSRQYDVSGRTSLAAQPNRRSPWPAALAASVVALLLSVGMWALAYRFGYPLAGIAVWVAPLSQALSGRWGLGWGSLVGTAAAAASAPYLFSLTDERYGSIPAAGACVLFGVQVGIVLKYYNWASRFTFLLLTTAPAWAVAVEHARARLFAWPTLLSSTPLSALPAGALVGLMGPLGMAWLNLFQQTLLAAALSDRRRRNLWLAGWATMLCLSSVAGICARQLPGKQIPQQLRVLVVQPGTLSKPTLAGHLPDVAAAEAAARLTLDALTTARPKLIIWPETTLGAAYVEPNGRGTIGLIGTAHKCDIRFAKAILQQGPGAYMLAGLYLHYMDGHRTNGAVLIGPDGSLQWYEKRTLVWFVESLPRPLAAVAVALGLNPEQFSPLVPGRAGRNITCRVGGQQLRLRIAICLEKYVYWDWAEPVDVVLHLGNESYFADAPSLLVEHRWALQARALQTRCWQFSAQTLRGSAVVDPQGHIHAQLPAGPGWLYFDNGRITTRQFSYAELAKLPSWKPEPQGQLRECSTVP